ncbi:MAG: protein-L-isoaspartate O-methyltransferase [Bacteroidia bacterium]|nr:MAG: protein-L-isoaspartate O-methyltransferase [Bacteroidia bacterium]
MVDTFLHKGLREQLLQELKEMGITDRNVLAAMRHIPRHFFFPKSLDKYAYKNKAFPIEAEQTISHPYTVAFQTSLLALSPGEKVLEVGTGSGYQSAVLMEMGANLFTMERQQLLFTKTKKKLAQMGYMPRSFFGDGYKGLPEEAPFDKILVTAGAGEIPPQLLMQMRVGGILVIPVGKGKRQKMFRIIKESPTSFQKEECGEFFFVPLLEGLATDENL